MILKLKTIVQKVKDFLGVGYGADEKFHIRGEGDSIKTYTGQELSTIGSIELRVVQVSCRRKSS